MSDENLPKKLEPGKRTFVPNLAIKREKKESNAEKPNTSERPKSDRRPVANNFERGRGRRQPNVIQSHSIFEAGPSEVKKYNNKEYIASGSLDRIVGSVSTAYISDDKHDVDSKNASKKIVQGSSLINEDMLIDELNSNEKFSFIKLPKVSIKKESCMLHQYLCNENRDDLILVQTPDSLQLEKLHEGEIGKLRVHRSGRITLCMNNNLLFNASVSSDSLFLQNVMSFEMEDALSNGFITSLGNIKQKIILVPEID